ncbi:ExbD/TolR family protein [Helicobacter enhydrae]|nr:biopolymer transporter ExbD [Helicobacter enhydrae]
MDSMNLVPFIDIMLVLLVIVLTSASFIQTSKVPIDIPKSQEDGVGQKKNEEKEVVIAIDKKGEIFVGEERVGLKTLGVRLESMDKKTHIILKGDKKSQFDVFVQVMQMLQKYKINNVYILVQEKQK